jgi:hypothetical protein
MSQTLTVAQPRPQGRRDYYSGVEGFVSLISAEPGWRALFADAEGEGTGRSRVIAWAAQEKEGVTRIVGVIADPNDPKSLVAADSVVDEDGGSLQRYGYVES